MGIDCSLILKEDALLQLKTLEERIKRMNEVAEFFLKKEGITNREEAIVEEHSSGFPRLRFEPYEGIVGINLYNGFWEIETCYGYWQFFEKGNSSLPGVRPFLYEIAKDLGCSDGYICTEDCAWNTYSLEDYSFEEWLAEMKSRFGEIPEYSPEIEFGGYDNGFPEIFHVTIP